MDLKNFRTLIILKEAKRRAAVKNKVKLIVLKHFKFDRPKLGIKRNRVYSLVSNIINIPNSPPFKRMVMSVMKDLGVRAVCVHKNYLFRGVYDDDGLAAHIEHEQKKAAIRAARKAAGLKYNSPITLGNHLRKVNIQQPNQN